jgi:putative ABC transport system ATP-binding protein
VDAALAILRRVGLADQGRRRPAALSGGEQQRAALALVLACRPRLLLADEVTGELDHASAAVVLDALDGIRAETGSTTLLVTHDADVAARAERVVEIRDGRTVDLGDSVSTSRAVHA